MNYSETEELCAGNADAVGFCLAFVNWVRWIDDAQDGDHSYSVEETIRINLEAAAVFSRNPFFHAHREGLLALIAQSFLAWEDSEVWILREGHDRAASQVMKSQYHEVLWHVAMLCGGLAHARAMTEKFREFDYDHDVSIAGQKVGQRADAGHVYELPRQATDDYAGG